MIPNKYVPIYDFDLNANALLSSLKSKLRKVFQMSNAKYHEETDFFNIHLTKINGDRQIQNRVCHGS